MKKCGIKYGLGIVTELREGYSDEALYWVTVLKPKSLEGIRVFYKEDLIKVKLEELTKEEIDLVMVELL